MKYVAIVLEIGGVVLVVIGASAGPADLIGVGVGAVLVGWGLGLASR